MLNRQWIAERPYIIAIVIALLLVLWMASGLEQTGNKAQESQQTTDKATNQAPIPKVKVENANSHCCV